MKKIVLFIIIIAIGWFVYTGYIYKNFDKPQSFKISAGAGLSTIADDLSSKGLIRNRLVFRFLAKNMGVDKKIMPGTYQFPAKASTWDIIKILSQPQTDLAVNRITIIEGWKMQDIADYLDQQNIATAENFLVAAKVDRWREKYDFLQDKNITSLEGFLFPDTYELFSDAKADDVIKKMLDNFNDKISEQMFRDLANQKRSLIDAVILASIIEREALFDEDRFIISDIFLKRIKAGIGLQSDATVNYVTGKKTSRPSAQDLQVDSPYNTYKYRGLPPGPISNPGLASLKASIYPQDNPYYYFLTDAKGKAIFGKTYAEHQENIRKYLDN